MDGGVGLDHDDPGGVVGQESLDRKGTVGRHVEKDGDLVAVNGVDELTSAFGSVVDDEPQGQSSGPRHRRWAHGSGLALRHRPSCPVERTAGWGPP